MPLVSLTRYNKYMVQLKGANCIVVPIRIFGLLALYRSWHPYGVLVCRISCFLLSNLQVVRQFGSSGITRVHGDADIAHWIENELGTLELKRLHVGLNGTNYTKNLQMHKDNTLYI